MNIKTYKKLLWVIILSVSLNLIFQKESIAAATISGKNVTVLEAQPMGNTQMYFPQMPDFKKNDEFYFKVEENGGYTWYRATVQKPASPSVCPGCPKGSDLIFVVTGEKWVKSGESDKIPDFDHESLDDSNAEVSQDSIVDPSAYKEDKSYDFSGSLGAATGTALTHGFSQYVYNHFIYTNKDRKELAEFSRQIERNQNEISENQKKSQESINKGFEEIYKAMQSSGAISSQRLDVDSFLIAKNQDNYVWKSPEGPFRDELEIIRNSIISVKTLDPRRQKAKDYGIKMTEEADSEFSMGNSAEAEFWKDSAVIMGDLATGWDPYSAFSRALYEVPTGKNFFTGKELSDAEMFLGVVDIISVGTSGVATNGVKVAAKLAKMGGNAEKGIKAINKFKKTLNSKIVKQQGIRNVVKKVKWIQRKYPDLLSGVEAFEALGPLGYDAYGILDNVIEDSEIKWGNKLTKIPDVKNMNSDVKKLFDGPVQKVILNPGQIVYQLQESGQDWQGKEFGLVIPKSMDSAEEIKAQILSNPTKSVVKMYRIKHPVAVYVGPSNGGTTVTLHIPFDPKSEYMDIMRELREYDLRD